MPGFNASPGFVSSSPVDNIQIDVVLCGVGSFAIPTLANSELNGTISGKSLRALNKSSSLARSLPIDLKVTVFKFANNFAVNIN